MQGVGQLLDAAGHLRLALDLPGMVEGDAGQGEQQHAGQAERRADPVPLAKGAEPEIHGGHVRTVRALAVEMRWDSRGVASAGGGDLPIVYRVARPDGRATCLVLSQKVMLADNQRRRPSSITPVVPAVE